MRLSGLRWGKNIRLTKKLACSRQILPENSWLIQASIYWYKRCVAYCQMLPCSKCNWKNKSSCKDVSKRQNDLYFQLYKGVLNVFQKTRIDSELKGERYWQSQECRFQSLLWSRHHDIWVKQAWTICLIW